MGIYVSIRFDSSERCAPNAYLAVNPGYQEKVVRSGEY